MESIQVLGSGSGVAIEKDKKDKKTKSGKSSKEKRPSRVSKSRSASRGKVRASPGTQIHASINPEDQPVPDGRSCSLCLEKDSSDDLAIRGTKRTWGYPLVYTPNVIRNQGDICFYCIKPYQAKYYPAIKLAEMPTVLGRDEEQCSAFKALCNLAIEQVKERQCFGRIQWRRYHIV